MGSAERYEIVNRIESGDFATVYRARDRELRREVAIKQIHQQFLTDPRQLERYWREAQLLASLQHPNIVTIYDVVRPRGWLVLELMRGNLNQITRGQPIDLDYLRVVMAHCLNALGFLHDNGIVHGDVKPSNMLVDSQNRVKLGDFGLARRASSEEGSLLKGTTKYMAPELISNQFGPVGPASDLYSLGFSSYEMLCGSQFESLFPGLSTFGRDEQIAWLMWHAAEDRNLPPINRVLEGVPEDLARVIETLVIKQQSRRFQSAEDVLQRLNVDRLQDGPPMAPGPDSDVAPAENKRLLRATAITAAVCSIVLSVWMLLPGRPKEVAPEDLGPARGVVRSVYLGERTLVVEQSENGSPKEISVKPRDEIVINDKRQLLRDLMPGDRVAIEVIRDATGRSINRIVATRPKIDEGQIEALDVEEGKITLAIGEAEDKLLVLVPGSLQIVFNGKKTVDGQPVTLADLRVDDRVTVHHLADSTGHTATDLHVFRVVAEEGTIRDVNPAAKRLTFARTTDSQLVALPLAAKCEVTINHRSDLDGQLLKLEDLQPGDSARISHHTEIVRVDAYRILGQEGVVQAVVDSTNMLRVLLQGQQKVTTFLVDPECEITLSGEPARLAELRAGDVVDVNHDSPDAENPKLLSLAATRPPDARRWAILVGTQDYEDRTLTPLEHPLANAELLRKTLIDRYRVPPSQALLLADVSQVRLEQGIPELLNRVQAYDQLIVYVAGHAYRDDDGKVYLAPKNFNLARISGSGVSLQWLVDRLEQCAAEEKLLLLDCCNAGAGTDLERQPSSTEMLESLDAPPGQARLRTVAAVASNTPGQKGLVRPDNGLGTFASSLAEGLSGGADTSRDGKIEVTELFAFLKQSMASTTADFGQTQTPKLFMPDDRPPRLSEEARKAIRKLAAHLFREKTDLLTIHLDYTVADELACGELEPRLLNALLLLKAKERPQAFLAFEGLRIEHPELLLPMQGIAWLHFDKRNYDPGVDALVELVSALPQPKTPDGPYSQQATEIFDWAGQIREFAAVAEKENYRPTESTLAKIDAAVQAHQGEANLAYEQGRRKTRSRLEEFDQRIPAADQATQVRLRVERWQLRCYTSFPFAQAAERILEGLD